MQRISAVAFLLCSLAFCAGSAQAARIVYSCNVVQDVSGASYPETITIDDDAQVMSHLKRTWSEGGRPLFASDQVQFVEVSKDRIAWGNRRKIDGEITDLFSVDLKTGRYAWLDTDGTEIAHGSCKLPDLTS